MGINTGANTPFWVTVVLVVIDLVVKGVALGLVPERRRPSSATAWLLLIFFVPYLGVAAYLLIGSTFVGRTRLREQKQGGQLVRQYVSEVPDVDTSADLPTWLSSAVRLNRRLGWLADVGNNDVRLLMEYHESIDAMVADVRTAQEYVHVQFYIMSWDSTTAGFFDALAAAAARGVKVRLLYDHLGSLRVPGYREMLSKLTAASIEWHPMMPVQPLRRKWQRPDLRNHRKIVVVDGRAGFVGSQNMIDPSYHNKAHEKGGRRWQDLMARVSGPVVNSLNIVFATDWFLETHEDLRGVVTSQTFADGWGDTLCQIVPSGPGFPDENNLRLFNTLIYGAEQRLSITSPYFIPDDSLLYAITTAAQRGVTVELFVCEQGDQFMVDHAQNSYYTALLEAGVRIFLYPAPAVLHAKHLSVDDRVAVIGSSNMDIRSFQLDFEVCLMGVGDSFLEDMRRVEDIYRDRSRELTIAEWRARSLPKRYVDNVMRLTSALQ